MTSDENTDTGSTDEDTDSTDENIGSKDEDTVGPELTQEDLDRAGEKMDGLNERYETGARETVTLPGTGGTVSGTAFADFDPDADSENAEAENAEAENAGSDNTNPDSTESENAESDSAENEKGERQPT